MSRTIRRKNQTGLFLGYVKAYGYYHEADWVQGPLGYYLDEVAVSKQKRFELWYNVHGDFRGYIYRLRNPMTHTMRRNEEQIFRAKERQKIHAFIKGITSDVIGNEASPPCPKEYWY